MGAAPRHAASDWRSIEISLARFISNRSGHGCDMAATQNGSEQEPTLGALVHDLSQQMSALVRSEVELAKAELATKGKAAGVGARIFGAAGVLALYAGAALATTAILAFALVLPSWAAALVVAVVLGAAAGVAGLVGKGKVQQATPPAPERAVEGLKQDVETIKGGSPA
jgi:uncharacterized membrane protein YqjE